jgi:hypothetical protein
VADNVVVGGVNYSTDDVTTLNGATIAAGTAQTQRMKVQYGDDGTARDVSQAFPIPVNLAASAGNIPDVTGSLTVAAASTVTGTASTTGTGVIDIRNAGNASFHLASTGTSAGHVVVFEQTLDPTGAVGWAPVPCVPEDGTSSPAATWTMAFPFTVGGVGYQTRQFTTAMLGAALFRVRLATLGTGTTLSYWLKGGPGFMEPQPALAPSNSVIGAVDLGTATTGALTSGTTSATANTNTVALAADATNRGARSSRSTCRRPLPASGTTSSRGRDSCLTLAPKGWSSSDPCACPLRL